VKEALNEELRNDGQWSRERVYRYPLPDNLGLFLEVDRGDVVEKVAPDSPAAKAGLQQGPRVARACFCARSAAAATSD
jgi:S1-C subfamily serine protease